MTTPSVVGSSAVKSAVSPTSRSARTGFGPPRDLACNAERDQEGGFKIDAPRKAEEAAQTFAGQEHEIVTRSTRKAAQPRLYGFWIRRIADGNHRTGDCLSPALF